MKEGIQRSGIVNNGEETVVDMMDDTYWAGFSSDPAEYELGTMIGEYMVLTPPFHCARQCSRPA